MDRRKADRKKRQGLLAAEGVVADYAFCSSRLEIHGNSKHTEGTLHFDAKTLALLIAELEDFLEFYRGECWGMKHINDLIKETHLDAADDEQQRRLDDRIGAKEPRMNPIKLARIRQNMTVVQLADKANLSVFTVNQLEQYKVNPSLDVCKKIAAALDAPLGVLFEKYEKGGTEE